MPLSQGDHAIFRGENSEITRNLGDTKNITIGTYDMVTVGDNPYQISPEINGSLYVANQGAGTVSVVDIETGTVTDTIAVGEEPYGLAYTNDKLFVANTGSDNVSIIDTTSNTVIRTISVGVKPYYVATIAGSVYVTNGASNTVSVIDAVTNIVIDTITVGSYPRGIKAYGTDLYVANYGDTNYSGGNSISVIDTNTNTVTDTIIMPAGVDGPRGVTVLGDNVYVANFRSNNVSVISTATNAVTDLIDVGRGPRGIVGIDTTLYVENFDASTVSVVDTTTNTVTQTIDVGISPSGIAIVGTDAYISSFQDNRVYKLNTLTNTLSSGTFSEVEEENGTPRRPSSGGTYVVPVTVPPVTVECPVGHLFSVVTGQRCTTFTADSSGTSTTNAYVFTRTLRLGMTGTDIQNLQRYLNTHGFRVSTIGAGAPGFETSLFGTKTKAAVIKFQIAKGLTGDGIVGPMTRSQLK